MFRPVVTLRPSGRKAAPATEPREAFGVRGIPALSRSQGHPSQKRGDAAHSKRFGTSEGIVLLMLFEL
jgi:hypothetical protein